jgi:hypothetical protein
MSDPTNFRMQRIEKLLYELRYEIGRGMMENEIDEEIAFRFYVPVSRRIPKGVVACRFETRPIPAHMVDPRDGAQPKLRIVGQEPRP